MPMRSQFTVHIVDDDEALRESIAAMLAAGGYRAEGHASPGGFLASVDKLAPGCALVDIRMPELDGLALQQALKARGIAMPVIFMTGFGDVALAVAAMKNGALDFVEKPCPPAMLKAAIDRAFAVLDEGRSHQREAEEAHHRLARLTPRERDVLDCLVAGDLNKVAAHKLGISPRTVELHRARIMEKTGLRSLADLVRLRIAAGGDRIGA